MSEEDHQLTQAERRSYYSKEDAYFKKLDEERVKAAKAKALSRKCPVDGDSLKEVSIYGVLVDRCDTCHGMWLDAHELDAIASALAVPAGFLKSFVNAILPPKR